MRKISVNSIMGTALLAGGLLLLGCQDKHPISGKVPTIAFKSYSGESLTLAGDDQFVTLLVFWATWCQPCLMEIPGLIKLHQKYQGQKFRVLGVNVDDAEGGKVKTISRDLGVNYPLLIGNDDIMKQFGGVQALPTAFLIGKDGRILEKFQGLQREEDLERKVTAALAGPT